MKRSIVRSVTDRHVSRSTTICAPAVTACGRLAVDLELREAALVVASNLFPSWFSSGPASIIELRSLTHSESSLRACQTWQSTVLSADDVEQRVGEPWRLLIRLACVGLYGVLCCITAVGDTRALTIPSWIPIRLIAVFKALALAAGDGSLINHLTVGRAALVAGIAIYALGWMADGDVKLISGAAVWAGPSLVAPVLLLSVGS